MELVIEGMGETIVRRRLMRFSGLLEAPLAAWEEVGVVLREVVELQFETEGGHASGGWPKLAESTIQSKARRGLDPHILVATDALRESLTRKFDPRHIERPSRESLTFGSNVAYGIYHQSRMPRSKIPYRPPIALTPADKRKIVKVFQESLREGMRQA